VLCLELLLLLLLPGLGCSAFAATFLCAETMEGSLEKNDFMDVFYTNFMDKLIAPVSGEVPEGAAAAKGAKQAAASSNSSSGKAAVDSSPTSNAASSSSSVPASTIGLIVDLLCFCVQHHQYFAKYHVLRWVLEACCSWRRLGTLHLLPYWLRWGGNQWCCVSAMCTCVSA
jgi:protein phosphatase-4 regulatory subunit 3